MKALLGVLLIAAASVATGGDFRPVTYDLEVMIHPSTGTLGVTGTVRAHGAAGAELEFLLHDGLNLESVSVEGRELRFRARPEEPKPVLPAARRITVELPSEWPGGELVLDVAYGGTISHPPENSGLTLDDAVEITRVELASYSAWYPLLAPYGARFAHDVTFVVPTGWVVVGTGEEVDSTESGNNKYSRWCAESALDIVCIASPDFQVRRIATDGAAIETYATRLPAAYLDREAADLRRVLKLFLELWGAPGQKGVTVRQVFSPREGGQGGFARPPLIVASEGRVLHALAADPELSLMRGVAHEAAHFWWSFGRGQSDWINETFAEYFSLVALERVRSVEVFTAALDARSEAVAGLPADAPSLATVPTSNDGDGYTIRYYKGCTMLQTFRKTMGDGAFFAASRNFLEAGNKGGATTEDFRSFWKRRLGRSAPLVDAWLDTPGGAPEELAAGKVPAIPL